MNGRLTETSLTDLPGGDLVAAGIEDLHRGADTIPALLVLVAAPRLRQLGFDVPRASSGAPFPEDLLYERLAREHGNAAHGRYNALLRTLASFTRAAACIR
jgi:hypothetical protein